MTVPTPGWQPLPECPGCTRPVRRSTARSNGGYCTTCRPRGASPVQALPEAERIDLQAWQLLAAKRGQDERQRRAKRRRHGH
jgi:hypothetical protein